MKNDSDLTNEMWLESESPNNDPAKVYIITSGEYSDYGIRKVFSTREKLRSIWRKSRMKSMAVILIVGALKHSQWTRRMMN